MNDLVEDLLHDIISYSPIDEIQKLRYLNKYYDDFIANKLVLDSIVWKNPTKNIPVGIIEKQLKNLSTLILRILKPMFDINDIQKQYPNINHLSIIKIPQCLMCGSINIKKSHFKLTSTSIEESVFRFCRNCYHTWDIK